MTRKKKKHEERKKFEEKNKYEEQEDNVNDNAELKYQCVVTMLVASIIISAVWALIRWGWLEFGLFPKVKTIVTGFFIPMSLSIIFILKYRHYISSIKDSKEEYVFGGAMVLSFLLFMSTGNIVESRMNKIVDIPYLTPDQKDVIRTPNYIHVKNLSIVHLDVNQQGRFLDYSLHRKGGKYSTGKEIKFHYYEVYPLRYIPNAFIGHEETESHNYTFSSNKWLNEQYRQFGKRQRGHLLRLNMNDSYLKRLLPSDNIEGFQHAVENISKEYSQAHQGPTIIYELVKKPKDTTFHVSIWLIVLLVEAILLAVAFKWAFVKKEYDEAVGDRRGLKSSFSFLKHTDTIVLAAMPVIMIAVLLIMVSNGFSNSTSNYQMLVDWGGLDCNLVIGHGEWWRLLTFGFLHSGFMHLAGNVLFYVICAVALYTHHNGYRITAVFLVSSLVSGLFVLYFSNGITTGASGGVFGLMAFWVVDSLYTKYVRKEPLSSDKSLLYLVGIIILNVLLSFGNGISMSGHLGGLVGGLVMGAFMCLISTRKEKGK